MAFRDRFYTPQTAKAILSWRIVLGVGATAALLAFGLAWPVAAATGVVAYGGSVLAAMPRGPRRPRIDPFTVQEPWRQFVHAAQRAASRLHQTVDAATDGPLKARVAGIVDKLDHGLDETWRIARRGHELDEVVNRLDPTALRSKLESLQQRTHEDDSAELAAAIASVEGQLAGTERLKQQSTRAANTLRLTQTRLDELVARAAEITVGAGDTDAYEHDVEDLVVELEALRLAVEETRTA
ncbi:MAG: hypothetical protein HKN44_04600 [Ilumatobacter sp.]|nr:hypothetical protein [Ilumatobacter sp.]